MAATNYPSSFATAMLAAGVKAGLVPIHRVKKDGNLKRKRDGVYWPRLKRNQAAYTTREVK